MSSGKRFLFVDLLRGAALAVMIEVHIVNAFIRPEYKEALWFPVLNFVNGLVAPSFIFISGFAFVISSRSGLDEIRSFRGKFWKKLGRIALIFLVAYSLHVPFYSFRNILTYASPADLKNFCNVDVLQCIGAGLLILFLARIFIKSDKAYTIFSAVMALLFTLPSPVLWNINFARFLPLPLACYFNEINGSFFPLFPWAGFLFCGALVSSLYLKARESQKEKEFIGKMLVFGLTSAVTAFAALIWLEHFQWFKLKPSPLFFLERAGVVLAFLSLCWLFNDRRKISTGGFFLDVSRESLVVYWLHLQLIYRRIWNESSLDSLVGRSFGFTECMLATAIMLSAMMTVAYLWGDVKKKNPPLARKIFYLTVYGSLALFFIM